MQRPTCPLCGGDMVYLVIPIGSNEILKTYICACNNEYLREDILDALEMPEGSLSLTVIPSNDDAAAFWHMPKNTGFSLS
jgi:hypothetical protein